MIHQRHANATLQLGSFHQIGSCDAPVSKQDTPLLIASLQPLCPAVAHLLEELDDVGRQPRSARREPIVQRAARFRERRIGISKRIEHRLCVVVRCLLRRALEPCVGDLARPHEHALSARLLARLQRQIGDRRSVVGTPTEAVGATARRRDDDERAGMYAFGFLYTDLVAVDGHHPGVELFTHRSPAALHLPRLRHPRACGASCSPTAPPTRRNVAYGRLIASVASGGKTRSSSFARSACSSPSVPTSPSRQTTETSEAASRTRAGARPHRARPQVSGWSARAGSTKTARAAGSMASRPRSLSSVRVLSRFRDSRARGACVSSRLHVAEIVFP